MDSHEQLDVFIAYTPYNVLLSYCLASNIEDGQQYLYVVPAFDNSAAETLGRLIKKGGVFDQVKQLPGKFDGATKRNKKELLRVIPHSIAQIRKDTGDHTIRRTFAALDTKEVVQAVMNESQQNIVFEDGAAAYKDANPGWMSISGLPRVNKLYYRIRCGFWWEQVSGYGTSSYVDGFRGIYPEMLKDNLQKLPTEVIESGPLSELTHSVHFNEYLTQFGVSKDSFENRTVVFLLPHSQPIRHHSQYESTLEQLYERLSGRNDVVVKAHPRDADKHPLLKEIESEFTQFPAKIPVELLYASQKDTIDVVIGSRSTSVYTSRWLCDDPTVLSYGPIVTPEEHSLFDMFEQIGVRLCTDHSELTENLDDALS